MPDSNQGNSYANPRGYPIDGDVDGAPDGVDDGADSTLKKALVRAAEAERRLDDITRLVSDWVWEADHELRLTYVSPRILNILGYHPRHLIGRKFTEIGNFTDKESSMEVMAARMPFRDEPFEIKHSRGSLQHALISGLPRFSNETGEFEGYRGTAEDVTERKKAEATVLRNEQRFRDFAASVADRFWETDHEHRLSYMSSAPDGNVILRAEKSIGNHRWELPGADPNKELWEKHKEDLDARRPFKNLRVRQIDTEGNIRHVRINGQPVFTDAGRFLGYRGTTIDETDSVLAQNAVATIQSRFFDAVENLNDGFALWDADEKFVHCNSRFREAHKVASEFLEPGRHYRNFMNRLSESRPSAKAKPSEWLEFREAALTDPTKRIEDRHDNRWFEVHKQELPDGSLVVIHTETTDKRAREEELRESRELLRTVTDSVPAFIGKIDRKYRYEFANGYYQTLGINPDDMIGKTYQEVFGVEDWSRARPYFDRALSGEEIHFEYACRVQGGASILTSVSLRPEPDDDGTIQGLHILALDITDRHTAEEALAEIKANLDNAQRIARIGSWERYMDSENIFWSDELYRIYGLDPDMGGMTRTKFIECMHPDEREDFSKSQKIALANGKPGYSGDYRILRPDGVQRILHAQAEITYDRSGNPVKLTGTAQDVTELRRAQEALEVAKRDAEFANRAKSEFLSSMSHELRTPMNAILGYAQLLLQNRKDAMSEAQTKQVGQILKSGHHLLDLINGILDLAKIEAGKVEMEIDEILLREILDECLDLVRSLADRQGIGLVDLTAGRDLPNIVADPVRCKQALLNLLSNAIKYNKQNGNVTVDCEIVETGMVRISVADNGIGIPEERRTELFEAFSRLGAEKSSIEGTGIGLIITKQLIELMEGRIGFDSTVGEGSKFWVELPVSGESTQHDNQVRMLEESTSNAAE